MGNWESKEQPKLELREGELELKQLTVLRSPDPVYTEYSQMEPRPQIGDIIAVERGSVNHYMVYLGGTTDVVIHFYAEGERNKKYDTMSILNFIINTIVPFSGSTRGDQPGAIVLENIRTVIGDDKCAVDNRWRQAYWYLVGKEMRKVYRNPESIVLAARAAFMRAREHGAPKYNLAKYNCETFALELKYGVRIPSVQVEELQTPIGNLLDNRLANAVDSITGKCDLINRDPVRLPKSFSFF